MSTLLEQNERDICNMVIEPLYNATTLAELENEYKNAMDSTTMPDNKLYADGDIIAKLADFYTALRQIELRNAMLRDRANYLCFQRIRARITEVYNEVKPKLK